MAPHLTLDERRIVAGLLHRKVSLAQIAIQLGQHRSTIHREIRRNFWHDPEVPMATGYWHMNAQSLAAARRARQRKLIRHDGLRLAVIERLKDGWSPEQIAGRLRNEGHRQRVCHETIYSYVYSKDGQSQEFARHLPERRRRRRARFAHDPARPNDQHRSLNLPASRLSEILCVRDQRQVGRNLIVHYERRKYILEDNNHARSAIGKYVETYAWPDRRLEVRWKGISLPYRVFDPAQQRVTHATITENKRLSEVLSWVKAQQESAPPKIETVGKQRSRYTPTGRKCPGRKSWVDKRAERLAAEAEAAQAKRDQTSSPTE